MGRGIYRLFRQSLNLDFSQRLWVVSEAKFAQLVVDVGCGKSTPLPTIPKTFYAIGLDIFKRDLTVKRNRAYYDGLILADARHLPLKEHCFDLAISLELIEHLPKHDGAGFLKELERIGRSVLVSTPNGFLPHPSEDDNIYQNHISGWSETDFLERGYQLGACGGVSICGGLLSKFIKLQSVRRVPRLLKIIINLPFLVLSDITMNIWRITGNRRIKTRGLVAIKHKQF